MGKERVVEIDGTTVGTIILVLMIVFIVALFRTCEGAADHETNAKLELILSTKVPGIVNVKVIDNEITSALNIYYVRFDLNKQSCYGKLVKTESVTVKHFEYQCEKLPATKSYE